MKRYLFTVFSGLILFTSNAQKKTTTTPQALPFDASTVSSLAFRNIGPALTSGRIANIAVHPRKTNKWYVAAASAGVWVTENHGTTFTPVFDNYGSFSIACVEIAPSDDNVIWVGTGGKQ